MNENEHKKNKKKKQKEFFRDFFFFDTNVRDGERHTHATTRGGVCGAFANLLFLEDDDDAG